MVRIINYKQRDKEDGTSFFVLELQGGIEMVKSQETGNFYATAKRAFIPSTFDEDTCSALIGAEMEGRIFKEECEPFTYLIQDTGEEITLNHRWVYTTDEVVQPKKQAIKYEQNVIANSEVFSSNGILEPVE
ncbi:hypothetical protein ULMA_02400 [Patiriisocius marinus]|uniref:Uncharacterized protein n=1 Tax=Patiriisocius marinus TaxID=1397112 RepID=A0A5J4IV77_9FLAO|nr:hypothetical protein [Patiriisocius marinus]GER58132.1 hypothetical protein ULMA_02400 [Patiriisocius marinus]